MEQDFDAWGPEAREFHLRLNSRPVKTGVHLRRLLNLAQGLWPDRGAWRPSASALELETYDAAYVENLLLAERRRQQLPTPTLPTPQRRELIDDIELEPADPALYDRFCHHPEDDSHGHDLTSMAPRHWIAIWPDLKLLEIANNYREVLDDAARKGSSMLEVLTTLIGMEQTVRRQRALERRLRQAHLPKLKTLADYDFDFPKRIPKTAIVRLFDCEFIPRHGCAVLMGPTGTGKPQPT